MKRREPGPFRSACSGGSAREHASRRVSRLFAQSDADSDECVRLMSAFVALKERKARAELIRLAEGYVASQRGGLVAFRPPDDG